MTDQNQTIALELEALIADYKKEQDDIRYYSGGPKQNRYTGVLVGTFLFNEDRILAALRTPAPAPVAVGGDVVALRSITEEIAGGGCTCGAFYRKAGVAQCLPCRARAALQAQPTASTAQPDEPQYLIRKGGAYYRPNAAGYTLCKAEAGRYTLADAVAYSHPNGPDGPRDGITYELDDTPAQPDDVVERVADAIEAASVGYSITLTKLVDGEAEYTATVDGQPPKIFPGHEEASEYVDGFRRTMKARAALAAMQQQAPVADDVAKAIEPVRPWYESDEHPPRELAAIVADIVSDLQSDRAECLRKSMLSDDQVKHMVNRFLMWKLPDNFNPDGGVSFEPEYNVEYNAKQGLPPQRHEPSGTNLLDYTQAEAMVRHMLDGLTQPQADAAVAVEPVTLNECPPGLFMFNGTLCFKSKYTTTLEA
jgi:hypothetical protein